jgi:hypothetical protein
MNSVTIVNNIVRSIVEKALIDSAVTGIVSISPIDISFFMHSEPPRAQDLSIEYLCINAIRICVPEVDYPSRQALFRRFEFVQFFLLRRTAGCQTVMKSNKLIPDVLQI